MGIKVRKVYLQLLCNKNEIIESGFICMVVHLTLHGDFGDAKYQRIVFEVLGPFINIVVYV